MHMSLIYISDKLGIYFSSIFKLGVCRKENMLKSIHATSVVYGICIKIIYYELLVIYGYYVFGVCSKLLKYEHILTFKHILGKK